VKPSIIEFLKSLQALAQEQNSPIFVVGGTLRDRFLGTTNTDFDFASPHSPSLAKTFANRNKLPLVALDDTPQRETHRVIVSREVFFDFTRMQGQGIEEDLAQRDFTINAMAQPLEEFIADSTHLIDPHGGQKDLKNRIIRVLPGPIFESDPLRLLRALRFASTLAFSVEENTFQKIVQLNQRIQTVAAERVTQELLSLLNTSRSQLEPMSQSGLLAALLPEIKPFRRDEFSLLENLLIEPQTLFPEYKKQITSFVSRDMHRALIKMTFLLLSLNSPTNLSRTYSKNRSKLSTTQEILKRLKWSNSHIGFVDRTLWFHYFILNQMPQLESSIDPKSTFYRFIRDAGQEVISTVVLTGAALQNKHGKSDLTEKVLNPILDFYFNIFLPKTKIPVLLDGNQLRVKFNLQPSPQMKHILAEIEEARVLGTITTQIEAEDLAKTLIQEMEQ